MLPIEKEIRKLGGIAKRSELLRRRHTRDEIDLAVLYGRQLLVVREGWYAAVDTPVGVLSAWRMGGRLGCISAAIFHGLELPKPNVLHVCVPANASRLTRVEPGAVLHWTDRSSMEEHWYGERAAVPIEEAVRQIARCPAASEAAAALWARQRNR